MKTISAVLVLATLVLSGCSTAVSPQKSTSIDVQKTGLVLVTLIRTGSGDGPKNTSIEFPFRPLDRPENSFLDSFVDRGINSSKELWLVEVPAGRYQIADWSQAGYWPRTEIAERPYEFEVRSGQITYLGRLEAAVVTVRNKHGKRMYSFVQPVLEDHHERTIAIFRREYPAFASVPVFNAAPAKLFVWNPNRTFVPDYDFPDLAENPAVALGPPLVFAPKFP